jgi:hypothetical protein
MKILDAATYERLIMAGLQRAGLSEAQAGFLCRARWPMHCYGALSEVCGRGIQLNECDFVDWLATTNPPDDLDPAQLVIAQTPFEEFLKWALANGRGKPLLGSLAAENPEIIDGTSRSAPRTYLDTADVNVGERLVDCGGIQDRN